MFKCLIHHIRRIATSLALVGMASAPLHAATLRLVPEADLQSLDPIATTANIVRMHGYLIYDTLYGLDANMVPRPQMVESATVDPSGRTYRFVLREGLKWHDEKPVTAEDCVASLKRWAARDAAGQLMNRELQEMRVIDSKTFELAFKQPFPLIYEVLAKVATNVPFMMPKRVAETDPAKEITEYIGSGPFKFVRSQWVPGSKVVYERFAGYVPRSEPASGLAGGKVAKVERVEWHILRDAQSAMFALTNGEVDLLQAPPTDLVPLLRSDKNISIVSIDKIGTRGGLFFNHTIPPFDNQKAREAMFWLTDQKVYLQAISGDPQAYRTCASFLSCNTPLASVAPGDILRKADPERAKSLFKEAGWDFAKPIVLLDPTDSGIAHPMAVVAAQSMRKIGLTVDLQAMDWATLVKRRTSRATIDKSGWNMLPSWIGGIPASNPVWSAAFAASCDKGPPGWACSPKMEELRLQIALAKDAAARKKVAEDFSREAFAYAHSVPLGHWSSFSAVSKRFTDLLDAHEVLVFWNIRPVN